MVLSRRAALRLEPDRLATDDGALDALHTRVLATGGSVTAAIELAVDLATSVALPGSGKTTALWSALATIAAADVSVARVVEPHQEVVGRRPRRHSPRTRFRRSPRRARSRRAVRRFAP